METSQVAVPLLIYAEFVPLYTSVKILSPVTFIWEVTASTVVLSKISLLLTTVSLSTVTVKLPLLCVAAVVSAAKSAAPSNFTRAETLNFTSSPYLYSASLSEGLITSLVSYFTEGLSSANTARSG